MKFNIPEIGDKLLLTTAWEFSLHAETRNVSLGKIHGYTYLWNKRTRNAWFPSISLLPQVKPFSFIWRTSEEEIKKRNSNLFGVIKDQKKYDEELTLFRNNQKKSEECRKKQEAFNQRIEDLIDSKEFEKSITIKFPKGTILIVDRVYIRQGAKEYSSLSFYAESPNWKGRKRFWAKLKDCNKINFKQL